MALDVCELVGSHTADNIVVSLQKTLADWEIENLFASVRDRGSNMISATHQLGSVCEWDLDCSAHKLNTCITTSISNTPEVKEIIGLVRRVIRHIKKSPKSWSLLKDDYISRNQGKLPTRPTSDSKTRWFSTYTMLRWFHNVKDSIEEVLPKMDKIADIEFSRSQLKTLDDVHSLLRPLAESITILEGDTYPTLAWVAEITYLLRKHVQNFQALTANGANFRDNLSDELDRLFAVFPDVVWMAALLTPSLRDSSALDGHRENAWKLLKARYSEVVLPDRIAEQERDEEKADDAADTSLQALRARYSKSKSTENDPFEEFKRFKALPGIQTKTLAWWKANESLFPRMALIAQKILAITATSASCERLFSTVGNVYTNKRQRMTAETARCQVLLKENKGL